MQRRELTRNELKTAANLKNILREKQLSQKQVATLMGFSSQGIVSQYCNGIIPMSDAVAIKFAKVLNVPIEAIKGELAKKLNKMTIVDAPHLTAEADNTEVGILKGDKLYIDPDTHKNITQGFYALDIGKGVSAYRVTVDKGMVKILDISMPVERASMLNLKGRIVRVEREW